MVKKSKRRLSKRQITPAATLRSSAEEFNPDYTYVKNDLKRIGILAGSFVAILVILSFVLPYILR